MMHTHRIPARMATSMIRIALVLLASLVYTPLSAQDDVDLVLQAENTAAYESYLVAKEEELWDQYEAAEELDVARMSLVVVKLARIQIKADGMVERIADAAADIDTQLADLLELIGDEVSEDDSDDLVKLLESISDTFLDDPGFEADVEVITDAIEVDNEEIESAVEDFGDVFEEELGDVSDLLDELLDSDGDFSVTFRVEGRRLREAEVTTITRADLDDLEAAIEDGEYAGRELADMFAGLVSAAQDWDDAVELLEYAESTEDNQFAIDAMRSAVSHLDAALLSLQGVFDSGPLDVGLDTGEPRNLLAAVEDILAGKTFAIGDKAVRPVALIESRAEADYLTGRFLEGAVILAALAEDALADADDYDLLQGVGDDFDVYFARRAEKARTRGWTWVLLAASAVGLADPPDEVFLEFWGSDTPVDETFRGYFPEGLSQSMLEVLGVDLVVNANATRSQMDDHMTSMRSQYSAAAAAGEAAIADPFAFAIIDTVGALEAHVGLAVVRSYFLVADNHQNVFDVVEMAAEGDIVGIVDRFDTEDFDYSASADSTEEDFDLASGDEDLVFLVLDKLDDDGNLFGIEMDDDVVPLPLTGDVLDAAVGILTSVARTASALAEVGEEAVNRAEESFELDLDPNELDFTEAEEPLDFALALKRSNENFLRLNEQGGDNMTDLGDLIEDALIEFADAVTDLSEFTADLEQEADVDLGGIADATADLDDFYQEMQADFEDFAATTEIDGEEVDLSAWFDNPPELLLQNFIWYLDDDDDTDNTLAGLLPGNKLMSVVLEQRSELVPESFTLSQNYPNPFNPETTVRFDLPQPQEIELAIYNLAAQRMAMLVQGYREAGSYSVRWDGVTDAGLELASGVYFYRLTAGERVETRKLLLLR